MKQYLQDVFTSRKWFFGTIIVLVFVILFCWCLINPVGFTNQIHTFSCAMSELSKNLITLVAILVGFAFMFGWRPFKKKGGGGH